MSDPSKRASLESLVEGGYLDLEVLHPGGLAITRELAELCHIGKGSKVLETASGTGESACFLAEELGASVVGVDLSDHLLARARRKAEQRNLAVEFKAADAHQLPFPDNTFDAVISECTTCLLQKERAIREMARVARPGGFVGIHDLCWKEDTPQRLKDRLVDLEGERPETLDGWKNLFAVAGLTEIAALDRTHLLSAWIRTVRRQLGLVWYVKILWKVFARWGWKGLRDVRESESIFASRYTGYGILVGRKPDALLRPA